MSIPGTNPNRCDIEDYYGPQRAIELESGGVLPMVSWPEANQPKSDIKFIERTESESHPVIKRLF